MVHARTGCMTVHLYECYVNPLTAQPRMCHGPPMQMREDAPHWKDVLREQGRSIAWLADQTGKRRRTVYEYSRGVRPPEAWLVAVSTVLGTEVAA